MQRFAIAVFVTAAVLWSSGAHGGTEESRGVLICLGGGCEDWGDPYDGSCDPNDGICDASCDHDADCCDQPGYDCFSIGDIFSFLANVFGSFEGDLAYDDPSAAMNASGAQAAVTVELGNIPDRVANWLIQTPIPSLWAGLQSTSSSVNALFDWPGEVAVTNDELIAAGTDAAGAIATSLAPDDPALVDPVGSWDAPPCTDPRCTNSDGSRMAPPQARTADGTMRCDPELMNCAPDNASHTSLAPGNDPWEPATGELVEQVVDVDHGVFSMRRTHRSRLLGSSVLGGFWSNHTEMMFVLRADQLRRALYIDGEARLRSLRITNSGVLLPDSLDDDLVGFVYPGTEHVVVATQSGELRGFQPQGVQSFTALPGGRTVRYRAIDASTIEVCDPVRRCYRLIFDYGRLAELRNSAGDVLVRYAYDPNGRLAQAAAFGGEDVAESTTTYVWDSIASTGPSPEAVGNACNELCASGCADQCAASCSTVSTSAQSDCSAECANCDSYCELTDSVGTVCGAYGYCAPGCEGEYCVVEHADFLSGVDLGCFNDEQCKSSCRSRWWLWCEFLRTYPIQNPSLPESIRDLYHATWLACMDAHGSAAASCEDRCNAVSLPALCEGVVEEHCRQTCPTSCTDSCTAQSDLRRQDCLGLCSGSCASECLDGCLDENGVFGGPAEDKIVAVINGNGDQYLTNEYGADPTQPAFGKLTRQDFDGRILEFTYTMGPAVAAGACTGRRGWYESMQVVEGSPDFTLRFCFDDRSRLRETEAVGVPDSLVLYRYTGDSVRPASRYDVATRTETRFTYQGTPYAGTFPRYRHNVIAIESLGHDTNHEQVIAEYRKMDGGTWLPGDGNRSRVELRYEPIYNRVIAVADPRGFEPGADWTAFSTTIVRDSRGLPIQTALPLSTERDGRSHQVTVERDFNVHGALRELRTDGATPVTYSYYLDPPPNSIGEPSGSDGAGLLAEVAQATSEGTLRTQFAYDAHGFPSSVVDPTGRATASRYDGLGLLQEITSACNAKQEWDYDAAKRPTVARHFWSTCSAEAFDSSLGLSAETTVDFNGRNEVTQMCRSVDGTNRCRAFTYDPFGAISSVERLPALEEQQIVQYATDALGRVNQISMPGFAPHNTVTASTTYVDAARIVQSFNAHGGAVTMHRDSLGRVVRVEQPDGTELRRVPDAADRSTRSEVWSAPDPTTGDRMLVAAQETDYGEDGLPIATRAFRIDADGTSHSAIEQQIHYNNRGQVTEVVQPTLAAPVVATQFDSAGRLESIDHVDGTESHYAYDSSGRIASVTMVSSEAPAWSIAETFEYDDLGQLAKRSVWDGGGELVAWEEYMLDSTGQLMGMSWPADELGGPIAHVHRDFNEAGQTRRVLMPDGTERAFTYDGLGRMTEFYDEATPVGVPSVQWDYASVADATRVIYADNSAVTVHRGDGGAIRQIDDLGGVSRTLTRDSMARVRQVDVVKGSQTLQQLFGFDALGRVTSATVSGTGLPTVVTDRQFDSLGNLLRDEVTTDGVTRGTWASVDALGRASAMGVIGDTTWTEVHYDGQSRPSSLTDELGATLATWTWSGSRLNGRAFSGIAESYSYDGAGRMARITAAQGSDVLFDEECRMTAGGNPDWCWDHFEETGTYYEYDDRSRLTQVGPLAALPAGAVDGSALAITELFDVDPLGNVPNDPARTYDAMSRLTAIDGSPTSHTAANEVSEMVGQQFTWDLVGQLRSVADGGASHAFVYDPFGRLIQRDGTYIINYGAQRVQDDGVLQHGADPSSDITGTRRYIYAGGEAPTSTRMTYDDPPLAAGLPTELSTVADRLGSVSVNVQTDGSVWDRRSYTAYGLSASPSQQQCEDLMPFGFTGRPECAGLTNMRARWYSPSAGRFISEDPVVPRTAEPNTYLYANANPVRFTDPLGLAPENPQQSLAQASNTSGEYWFGNSSLGGSYSGASGYDDREYSVLPGREKWEPGWSGCAFPEDCANALPFLPPDSDWSYVSDGFGGPVIHTPDGLYTISGSFVGPSIWDPPIARSWIPETVIAPAGGAFSRTAPRIARWLLARSTWGKPSWMARHGWTKSPVAGLYAAGAEGYSQAANEQTNVLGLTTAFVQGTLMNWLVGKIYHTRTGWYPAGPGVPWGRRLWNMARSQWIWVGVSGGFWGVNSLVYGDPEAEFHVQRGLFENNVVRAFAKLAVGSLFRLQQNDPRLSLIFKAWGVGAQFHYRNQRFQADE